MVVSYPDESTWNILAIWEVYRNTFFIPIKTRMFKVPGKEYKFLVISFEETTVLWVLYVEKNSTKSQRSPRFHKISPCQGLLYVPFGGVKHHPAEAVISNQPLFAMSNGDIANHGFGRKPLEHADLIYRQSIQHMIALFLFLKSWFVPMVGECKNRGISSI